MAGHQLHPGGPVSTTSSTELANSLSSELSGVFPRGKCGGGEVKWQAERNQLQAFRQRLYQTAVTAPDARFFLSLLWEQMQWGRFLLANKSDAPGVDGANRRGAPPRASKTRAASRRAGLSGFLAVCA